MYTRMAQNSFVISTASKESGLNVNLIQHRRVVGQQTEQLNKEVCSTSS